MYAQIETEITLHNVLQRGWGVRNFMISENRRSHIDSDLVEGSRHESACTTYVWCSFPINRIEFMDATQRQQLWPDIPHCSMIVWPACYQLKTLLERGIKGLYLAAGIRLDKINIDIAALSFASARMHHG